MSTNSLSFEIRCFRKNDPIENRESADGNILAYYLRAITSYNFFLNIYYLTLNTIIMIEIFGYSFSLSNARANVQGKDITLYVKTKQKFATNVSMKKPNFKAAIEQIELALNGEDPAPISYDVTERTSFLTLTLIKFIHRFIRFTDSIRQDEYHIGQHIQQYTEQYT